MCIRDRAGYGRPLNGAPWARYPLHTPFPLPPQPPTEAPAAPEQPPEQSPAADPQPQEQQEAHDVPTTPEHPRDQEHVPSPVCSPSRCLPIGHPKRLEELVDNTKIAKQEHAKHMAMLDQRLKMAADKHLEATVSRELYHLEESSLQEAARIDYTHQWLRNEDAVASMRAQAQMQVGMEMAAKFGPRYGYGVPRPPRAGVAYGRGGELAAWNY
eukprot:TRINITY_DN6889_c0_g1_i1.p1 TRINITY_DN6889_c0_g1~~TRINITY_DN6889_c0_g1_i1.p1  ORF type:complete len:213 (-),score=43.18 TRINITY_DN6889_c0_g1_i1:157-795(-)